ncbi:MAG TPA: pyridoxal 5'-phosphate synthase [Solirubrobacterales bacterium]|nr:pyridoxal 5'-phosphate synthase [Solirubrobacterales bacterium]
MTETLTGDATLELPEFAAPPADPLRLLAEWVATARSLYVREPLAITLATVDAAGSPSSRVVLLKGVEPELLFTSHHGSRKGRDLEASPRAAATLDWRETLQQVNLAGTVERIAEEESDRLFAERPRAARATTVASRQSEPLVDDEVLRSEAERLAEAGDDLLRPRGWGGYRFLPERIEFWHGSADRLHRRLEYAKAGTRWAHRRLQP